MSGWGGHAVGEGRVRELLVSAKLVGDHGLVLTPCLLCSLYHAFSTSQDAHCVHRNVCRNVVHSLYPQIMDLMPSPCCTGLSLGITKTEHSPR